ncbi:MAG: META domain-containing protein [Fusobacteriaceae bacterium]
MKKLFGFLLILSSFVFLGCSASNLHTNKGDSVVGNNYSMIYPYMESEITLNFEKESFSGMAGINRIFGEYSISKNNDISFSKVGMTKMAGPLDLMTKEDYVVNVINNASKIEFLNHEIIIISKDGKSIKYKHVTK